MKEFALTTWFLAFISRFLLLLKHFLSFLLWHPYIALPSPLPQKHLTSYKPFPKSPFRAILNIMMMSSNVSFEFIVKVARQNLYLKIPPIPLPVEAKKKTL